MSEFVDCRTCKTDCVRADGNYGYTFCDKYTHPPMTNADRIRSMSDEELVNVVPCPLGFSMFRCPIERQCGPCKREWLKQPAEEAGHER